MNIVLLSEDFYPTISGGAHEQWRFAQLAAERGHNVVVFTQLLTGTERREHIDGVDIRRPSRAQPEFLQPNHPAAFVTRLVYSVYLFAVLVWWLWDRDVDVILSVSHLMHWTGAVVSRIRGIPHVSYIGYTPSLKSEFRISSDFVLERLNFALFMGELVYCRAPRTRSILRRYNNDVRIIHGIINSEKISGVYSEGHTESQDGRIAAEGEYTLVFVGRLTELKQPLQAVSLVASLPQQYQLLIIGTGPLESAIEQEIRRYDITDRVELLGQLPHADTLERIAAADGLLLTSKAEAYPTVVFEALALNKPVFSTEVGILPDIEHERLHLSPVERMDDLIREYIDQAQQTIDVETLEQYSMQTYAETMLKGLGELNG